MGSVSFVGAPPSPSSAPPGSPSALRFFPASAFFFAWVRYTAQRAHRTQESSRTMVEFARGSCLAAGASTGRDAQAHDHPGGSRPLAASSRACERFPKRLDELLEISLLKRAKDVVRLHKGRRDGRSGSAGGSGKGAETHRWPGYVPGRRGRKAAVNCELILSDVPRWSGASTRGRCRSRSR